MDVLDRSTVRMISGACTAFTAVASTSRRAPLTPRRAATVVKASDDDVNDVSSNGSTARARAFAAAPMACAMTIAMVVSMTAAPDVANALEANERDSAFVSGLLAKSEAKRDERAKERLDAYNKKNFGDYLAWQQGDKALMDPSKLSDNDRAIAKYLESIK